jgi:hypothetical protein
LTLQPVYGYNICVTSTQKIIPMNGLEVLPTPDQMYVPPPVVEQAQPRTPELTPEREALLQQMLGTDYDYAKQSGLIDVFDYDPATNQDGLLHILTGDMEETAGGVPIPSGFHHEPSAQAGGSVVSGEVPSAQVDRSHLEDANSEHRKKYRERPAEPYLAQVAIGGQPKMEFVKNAEGTMQAVRAKSAMYPQEYDALAVMQSVRQARDTSEGLNGRVSVNARGETVIITNGTAKMIDGVTDMPIRLVLNPKNMRVKSAYPIVKGKTGLMNLTEDQMMAHATYQTPTSSLRS